MTVRAGDFLKQKSSGWFSLGTRNTFSIFNDIENETNGKGIGGQFRVQLNDRLNTEWFADYLFSEIGGVAQRNDYHIGWSVMYYVGKDVYFEKVIQPYILIGHCFDKTNVFITDHPEIKDDRWSLATQAGVGTHINITDRLDISLSGQYMLHFGKELNVVNSEGVYFVEKEDHTHTGGHMLISVSANFKFGKLWSI
jgi:opacity protein-like surface antigen